MLFPFEIEEVIVVLVTGLGCPSEKSGVSNHGRGERNPSKANLGSWYPGVGTRPGNAPLPYEPLELNDEF